jgi:hypothetical protein
MAKGGAQGVVALAHRPAPHNAHQSKVDTVFGSNNPYDLMDELDFDPVPMEMVSCHFSPPTGHPWVELAPAIGRSSSFPPCCACSVVLSLTTR